MDLSDTYANSKYTPDWDSYPGYWADRAARFRSRVAGRSRLDIAYGDGARQRFDLFRPEGRVAGLAMFVHGGYWMATDKSVWSHLAAGPLARGWAVAMPSYSLAPGARISAMTREIAEALVAAAGEVTGPIVVTGHSAGGHLAARMRCSDVALPEAVARRIGRVLPISPLADLRPLLRTGMNADLRLDLAEAEVESPVLCSRLRDIETVVWVGAEERPAFLDQARWLAGAWPRCTSRIAPGRHHFDLLDGLEQPDSPLMRSLLGDLP